MEHVAHWSWHAGTWSEMWLGISAALSLVFLSLFDDVWLLVHDQCVFDIEDVNHNYFTLRDPRQTAFYLKFYLKKQFVILIYFNQQSISLTFIILTCILTFHLTFYPAFYLILYSAFDLILYSAFDLICYLLYIYIYTCYLINALPFFSAFWVRSGNVFRGTLDGLGWRCIWHYFFELSKKMTFYMTFCLAFHLTFISFLTLIRHSIWYFPWHSIRQMYRHSDTCSDILFNILSIWHFV